MYVLIEQGSQGGTLVEFILKNIILFVAKDISTHF